MKNTPKQIHRAWYVLAPSGIAVLAACSSPASSACEDGACAGVGGTSAGHVSSSSMSTNASAGTGGAGTTTTSSVDAGPVCVPKSGPDLPDDAFADTNCDGIDGDIAHAVFVAPSGNDANAGTMAAPMAHIQKGITLASAAGKDVYICLGTYAETLVLDNLAAGIGLYGGYDCAAGWKRGANRPMVAPTAGIPLRVRNAASAVVVDRLAFLGPGGLQPGASSVVAFVSGSAKITLSQVVLEAGDGADGQEGAAVVGLSPLGPGPNGASVPTMVCASGTALATECYQMGAGGTYAGIASAPNGGRGGNYHMGFAPGAGTTAPGGALGGTAGHDGLPGHRGPNSGAVGAASTVDLGTIGPDGYLATNAGADGSRGDNGQPGGGGAGGLSIWPCGNEPCTYTSYAVGGGGGAGGLGGAGGPGGKAGGGGGASIALLSVGSGVSTSWTTFKTGTGGRGGSGSQGANGQTGGAGGKGGTGSDASDRANGTAGGLGGNGNAGGAGGPGGGGPSIGVLVQGTVPTHTAAQFQTGKGGKGGIATGIGTEIHDGVDGRSADSVVWGVDGGAP